jgi:hypothetical protein
MSGPYAAYFGEHIASAGIANSDLSAKQFYLVKLTGSLASVGNGEGLVDLNAVSGAGQVKVMVNAPKAGDPAFLWDLGEVKVVAGAAITVGGLVMSDGSGRVIPYVNNGVNVPIGEARQSTVNGASDVITCFMWPTPSAGGAVEGAISDGITPLSGGTLTGSTPVLVNGWNRATGAAATGDSLVLPAAVAGMEIVLINDCTVAATLQIFAHGSDTIDGTPGATGVANAIAKRTTFYCLTAPRWQSDAGAKST